MLVDEQILISNQQICKNIDRITSDDIWFISQNILSALRTFVEAISVKLVWENNYTNEIFKSKAKAFIWTNYDYLFKFHKRLQISESHYIQSEDNSKRLMWKYYEYLLKIKKLLKEKYNLNILENLDKFPLNNDENLQEYYQKISLKIDNSTIKDVNKQFYSNYYIWKKKPFFVNDKIYYEVTFSDATDNTSKFDRIIAFTDVDLSINYATKLKIVDEKIDVFWKDMPILIIKDFEISIRPCELSNFYKILGENHKFKRDHEYEKLMKLLKKYKLSLFDISNFPEERYVKFKKFFLNNSTTSSNIINLLDISRNIIKNNLPWSNVLRYLIYHMNNVVIKKQFNEQKNKKLSNLNLQYWCIPFDNMPLCSSLLWHNPIFYDVLESIDIKNKDGELMSKAIQNNIRDHWELYMDIKQLDKFNNIDDLIKNFNSKIYQWQSWRRLEIYKNHVYSVWNEKDIVDIINIIKDLWNKSFQNYSKIVDFWLAKNPGIVDDENKKEILRRMFEKSWVALIYWSAWTWKTTLIWHISNLFENQTKLFLANTNPAMHNLEAKVNNKNSEFNTIYSWKKELKWKKYNILVIDECSTVSNADFLCIIKEIKFDLLVLVWDIYQIEAIDFWNWFRIIKNFIPQNSVFELENPYRTTNNDLKKLWNKVRHITYTRNNENDLLETILPYSKTFDDSIFTKDSDDEIILCLNYDWLYGINNINKFLQSNNKNSPIQWGSHIYKIWDPVLFNETQRFLRIIYNNLKWKIINIEKEDDKIYFSVEVDKEIEITEVLFTDIELLESSNNGKSKIRFFVNKLKDTDEDDSDDKHIVPFQIAYAISIHKAQWLEYDSVKIIISDEIDEKVTHNIFYTAITRAREKLKIYWSDKTSKKILNNLEEKDDWKDIIFLKNKFNL